MQDQSQPQQIVQPTQPNQMQQQGVQPVVQTQPQYQSQPPAPQNTKKRGFLKIVAIIFGVFIVIGILLFGFRLVTNNIKNASDGNKPVEITWWGLWQDSSVVDSLIAQYQNDHPNVVIKYEKQSTENYRERLANALISGKGPDIFRIHNTWIPMFRAELSPLPAEIMPQDEYEQTFYRVALESALTDNGILAIPLQFDALGLFVNEEIFSTFAKTIPNNWEDLRKTAEDLTIFDTETGTMRQAGVALGLTDNVDYWQDILGLMLVQNRAKLTEPSDDEAIGALKYYLQFVIDTPMWDDTQADSIAAFTTGRVAMIFAPSSAAHKIKKENPSLEFRVVPVPQLAKNSSDDPDITYASFWMEGVSSRSKKQQQAWEFLKYMTQADNLEKLYQNETNSKDVYPEIYPRQDMRGKLLSDKYVGGIVKYAPAARFWYLAANTNDGDTGINSKLATIFKDALVLSTDFKDIREQLGKDVRNLLATYGLAMPVPVEEKK